MKKQIILIVTITVVISSLVCFISQRPDFGRNMKTGDDYSNNDRLDQVETFEEISFLVPSNWRRQESSLLMTYYPSNGDSTKLELLRGLKPNQLNINDISNKEEIELYLEQMLDGYENNLPDYQLFDKYIGVFNDTYTVLIDYKARALDGFVYETMTRVFFTEKYTYFLTFSQPIEVLSSFRALFYDICDSVQIGSTDVKANAPNIEDFLTVMQEAGFPIKEVIVYDAVTDPNSLLGRPHEYSEKADFSHESISDLTIEIFQHQADAIERKAYYTFLKQYIFLYDRYMMRIPYALTPDIALRYEETFVKIINGEAADDVSSYFPKAPVAEEDDLEAYANNIQYELHPLLNGEAVIVFTNNNDIVIPEIDVTLVFYDDEGDMLVSDFDSHYAVLPGSRVVTKTSNASDPTIDFKNNSIDIKVNMDTNDYESLSETLSVKSNKALDGGIIAKITNNADKEVEEVELAALFYIDGSVVAVSFEEKYDILPGESDVIKFRAPYDAYDRIIFDSYELIINQANHFNF